MNRNSIQNALKALKKMGHEFNEVEYANPLLQIANIINLDPTAHTTPKKHTVKKLVDLGLKPYAARAVAAVACSIPQY